MFEFGVVFVGWGCCICLPKYVNVSDMARKKSGAKVLENLWYSTRSAGSNLMEEETSTIIATSFFLKTKQQHN